MQPNRYNINTLLAPWGLLALALIVFMFTISLAFFPQHSYQASLAGLQIWWEVVFPASLPFFIGSQVLIGLGAVHFLGVLLSPLMRPFFNVPGSGAFALAMGISSGNPLGGAVTAELRKQNLCSKSEGERLVSFTNNANLLFMGGAVAVGMFNRVELGLVFALSHYLATIAIALLYRFYRFRDPHSVQKEYRQQGYLRDAFLAMQKAKKEDGRPFGKLLGDSVSKSISILLMIGGFIMLFSVLTSLLSISGLMDLCVTFITPILEVCGFDPSLAVPIITSFLEITNGIKLISISGAPLEQQVLLTCAVISWSGLSIQAQVASVISDTDLNIFPYLVSRLIHATLSLLFASLIIKYIGLHIKPITVPVFSFHGQSISESWLNILLQGLSQFIIITMFFVISTFFIHSLYTFITKISPQKNNR